MRGLCVAIYWRVRSLCVLRIARMSTCPMSQSHVLCFKIALHELAE